MTKNFSIGAVLSVTTHRLLCPLDDLYAIAEHLIGGPVFSHMLADDAMNQKMQGAVWKQHPQLKELTPEYTKVWGVARDNWKQFLAEQEAKFGKELPIAGGSEPETADAAFNSLPAEKVIPVIID